MPASTTLSCYKNIVFSRKTSPGKELKVMSYFISAYHLFTTSLDSLLIFKLHGAESFLRH